MLPNSSLHHDIINIFMPYSDGLLKQMSRKCAHMQTNPQHHKTTGVLNDEWEIYPDQYRTFETMKECSIVLKKMKLW